jgi:NADPH-dependent 2,4-dienoyl-CoA reductase/sulfur reductase-like enzyme
VSLQDSNRSNRSNRVERVVVVGGSLGGVSVCENLRRGGFAGTITVVDADAEPCFDRPPLSKQFLAGERSEDEIRLRTAEQLDVLRVTWRLGVAATSLDLEGREVALDDGSSLGFDRLVIATGASARFPAPLRAPNAIAVRSIADGRRLREMVVASHELVVIGAGFLGLEAAATCRRLGVAATVVEALDAPLKRVMPPVIGEVVRRLHEREGVVLRFGVGVVPYGGGEPVPVVELEDGTKLPTDMIVVAIGSEPSTTWLEDSGLKLDGGVVCDENLEAAPGIYAVGDVARWPHPLSPTPVRVEHWTNAIEQGRHVARAIVDPENTPTFSTVPYFWSHQYSANIQAFGLPRADDEVRVVAGDLESGTFVACLGRDGALAAAVGFNAPKQLGAYRRMLAAGASFEEATRS